MADASLPPYLRIAADLESQIRSGVLAPGARLRSIADLAYDFEVNKNTVVKALDVLKAKGMVESRQGWGTFVSASFAQEP
jgi:DNA-binding GntR family transcriptional regulator